MANTMANGSTLERDATCLRSRAGKLQALGW